MIVKKLHSFVTQKEVFFSYMYKTQLDISFISAYNLLFQ